MAALAGCGLVLSLASGAGATVKPPKITEACAEALVHQRPVHPKLLPTRPPAGLTSILGVLRRPATSSDVLPEHGVPTGYSVLWITYVRLLATSTHTQYFLIPGVYDDPLPAACRSTLPPKLRREERRYDRAQRHGSVSLEAFGRTGGEGAVPLTRGAIERGDVFIFPAPGSTTTPAYGLVPDGVAAVAITGRAGRTVTTTVAENFFLLRVPVHPKGTAHHKTERFTVRWYAATGAAIKKFVVKLDIRSVTVIASRPTSADQR